MKVPDGKFLTLCVKKHFNGTETMIEDMIYYFEDTGKVWFFCPCGEDHLITVPTRPQARGIHWVIDGLKTGKVSLHPDIIGQPCGTRFHILDGKISRC